jgi:hypothetical protein
MGMFFAVAIIIVLIFYALKDLLVEKDFSAWTNIALTSLILFTVILSIFMILHKEPQTPDAHGPKPAAETTAAEQPAGAQEEIPVEDMTDEQIRAALAREYVTVEEDYKKNNPKAKDSADVAANYIKNKYKLTEEEWAGFLADATAEGLFDKAREKQGINYLIKK